MSSDIEENGFKCFLHTKKYQSEAERCVGTQSVLTGVLAEAAGSPMDHCNHHGKAQKYRHDNESKRHDG